MKFSQLFQTILAVAVIALSAAGAHAQTGAATTDAPAMSEAVPPANVGAPEAVTAPEAPAAPFENVTAQMRAQPWQMGMLPAASPVQERLFSFHNLMLVLITVVSVLVLVLMIYTCLRFSEKNNPTPSKTSHNTLIEVIWTLLPVLILVCLAVPSLKLLYFMDKTEIEGKADLTIKVIGYQWYWNYEYPDAGFAFDSYMVEEEDLKPGQPRLLTVDNAVYVPVGKKVRVQLTGGDVIHSWAMPNFGVKLDAVPGHLNETWFQADVEGTYYGQCSELCGVRHGFMPITVHVVSQEEFDAWIEQAKERFAAHDAAPRVFAALR